MDGEHADIVRRQAPDGESATERGDARVRPFEHAEHGERVLLLPGRLLLDAVDASGELFLGELGTLLLAELDLLLQLVVLVREPLRDLLPTELELAGAVLDVQNGQRLR